MTPFKAVYGRDPPVLIKYEAQPADPPSLQSLLTERDMLLAHLKGNLNRAQQIMKRYADTKRRFCEFNIGDLVLVKLQPYRQHSATLRKNQKLGLRYFGPFLVLERIGQVAYKLLLPSTAKTHPVFHVSALKPCQGDHSTQYFPLSLLTTEQWPLLSPVAILQSRKLLQGDESIDQVLV